VRRQQYFGRVIESVLETRVRLGVTGLRRSGKTVFVTSLVDNMLKAGRLPMLEAAAQGRYQGARLNLPRATDLPRFAYESHLATLTGRCPDWPEATRRLHQMRLTLRVRPGDMIRRTVVPVATINLDILDYPGEWLLDLPLLQQSYADWSAFTLAMAEKPPRRDLAEAWLTWLDRTSSSAPADEATVEEGSRAYTQYLFYCRDSPAGVAVVQPGRFIEPGDLAGAPLLNFCPMRPPVAEPRRHSLWSTMESRYDAYRDRVVAPFFRDHFSSLDRQIVLVDVLRALSAGPMALADLQEAVTRSLEAFNHGRSSWLGRLFGSKIDRVLLAATKADHIPAQQHLALRQLVQRLLGEARRTIRYEGAEVEAMALAAVKCTSNVMADYEGRRLPCIRGKPFGRDKPVTLFPGEIADPGDPFSGEEGVDAFRFLNFCPPPRLDPEDIGLPHIRIDQALQFLLGDYLA